MVESATRTRELNLMRQGPISGSCEIVKPLPLRVVLDTDGWYVASSDDIPVHGDGATIAEAVTDFDSSLAEYCEIVEAGAAKGNRCDQAELDHIHSYVRRIQPS